MQAAELTASGIEPDMLDPSCSGLGMPAERRRRRLADRVPGIGTIRDLSGWRERVSMAGLREDLRRPGPIRSGRLAGLSMGAAIWTMAWPGFSEQMLSVTLALVDTWIAAHVSKDATDAVGSAVYALWFVGLITSAIGVGATALIARSLGAGRPAVARAALGQAMLLSVGSGVVLAVALALLAPVLAAASSLSGQAAEDFRVFMLAAAAGVPFTTLLFAGNACCRGAGDTFSPLVVMLVVNVINAAGSWVLAIHLQMGVLGIGLGMSLGHFVGACMVLRQLMRGVSGVALTRRRLWPHAVTLARLVRLALPNLLEMLGMFIVNYAIVLMVGLMSAAAAAAALAPGAEAGAASAGGAGGLLGAHLIAIRLEAFSFVAGFSMGMAASALCGQYLGAGAPELARKAALVCTGIACAVMGLWGVVLMIWGPALTALISPVAEHAYWTPQLLFITGIIQVPFAMAIVLRSAMHGAGDTRATMWMTLFCQWGLRLPIAYALCGVDIPVPAWIAGEPGWVLANPFPFHWGLPGLWIGLCAEIVIRATVYTARFLSGRWARATV